MTGAICIASGPSLTQDDVDLCKTSGRTIYVVNDVYTLAPWADVLYAADIDWWNHHEGAKEFNGERWGCDPRCCERWGLNLILGTSSKKFGLEPPIAYGGNSGFQALNLTYIHGHRDVWLLGYDMGFTEGGDKHFFGDHPRKIDRTSNYTMFIERFKQAKPIMDANGLNVINMTPKTALNVFERGMLCEFL